MNILYLVPFWPHLYTPFLFREIGWMRARGHGVAVISTRRWHNAAGDPPLAQFGVAGVPVLQVRRRYESDRALVGDVLAAAPAALGARGRGRLRQRLREAGARQGLHEWASFQRVLRFAAAQRAEVIDAHWATEAAELARQIGTATGLPYAVTSHGGDLCQRPSPALPQIIRDAAAITPVSSFLARLLRGERPAAELPPLPTLELDPAKLRIRPHGLPAEVLAARPAPQRDDAQLVVTTGRLDPEKRHRDLLQALGALAPQYPGLRLRIIGGGQLQPRLLEQARQLGIEDRLELCGAQPWEQVIRLLREGHIYVQASAVEGFGLATLEGAAQGLPVVASRTGVHEDLVEPGANGYLFNPGDVAALREHLRRLLEIGAAARFEMGASMLRRVRERFAFDQLMPRVERILEAVRAGRELPA